MYKYEVQLEPLPVVLALIIHSGVASLSAYIHPFCFSAADCTFKCEAGCACFADPDLLVSLNISSTIETSTFTDSGRCIATLLAIRISQTVCGVLELDVQV